MHLEVNKMFEFAHDFFIVRVIRTSREIEIEPESEKTNGKAGNEKEDEGENEGQGEAENGG